MADKLTAVSLFSGCGGFDWGAKEAGVEIIWANDIDPHAAEAYQSLFPQVEFVHKDIKLIESFPRADVLIGCYPCTGFSEAARRRGRKLEERDLTRNENNFLYREFIRVLEQVRPKYLFVENVSGMTSANNGWFLQEQLRGFRESGYRVTAPHVVLASDFGLAQSRKRVFIVGVKDEVRDFEYTFPKPTHGPDGSSPYLLLKDVIGGMNPWPEGEFITKDFHGHYLTRNRKRGWGELSYTIVAHGHHIPLHPSGEPMKPVGKDQWALQGDVNRRLSWRECAIIQGLPSHINPSGSLMDKHKVVGNAVPPPVAKALIRPIVEFETAP